MFLKSKRWIANLEDITTKKHLVVVKIEPAYIHIKTSLYKKEIIKLLQVLEITA